MPRGVKGAARAVIVDCAHYRGGVRQHEEALDIEQAAEYAQAGDGFVWVGLLHPTDEELAEVAKAFHLHELAVEDAGREHQRPKLEEYEGTFFLVLKTARYDEAEERVHFGEIDLFLGPGYAVSARHGEASPLTGARERLQTEHRELMTRKPRPGDPDRSRELRARPGWAWMRVFRRYDEYQRALGRLDAAHDPDVPRDPDVARHPEHV